MCQNRVNIYYIHQDGKNLVVDQTWSLKLVLCIQLHALNARWWLTHWLSKLTSTFLLSRQIAIIGVAADVDFDVGFGETD